ncbi:hypothetical protein OsJ_21314 [Oryza sativa Japonica Group]|uniref:CCHC-type domain-containing protein n=1 Tax=Oryza sativa subsp. japonica TaxID=39947 RepID=B9FT80_ORYSJ|nr:hypothetical protein OsJ_21314 [Oryza sativa Japonica Group]
MAQFNELRRNMEARQDRMAQDVQNILGHFENINPFGGDASVHSGEDEEDDNDDLPYRFGRIPRRRNNDEERLGKLKFTIPKFDGGSDLEAYLMWELKVDKIFHIHNYSEEKKLAMASLEFEDYALICFSNGKEAVISSVKSKPTVSSTTSIGSTSRSRDIQCFKCGGRGHVVRECPNNRAIIVIEHGEFDSASEV